MIRFVIRRKILDRHSGLESERLETIDCECPELQSALMRGGYGMNEYDYSQLVGVELLQDPTPSNA
jgi:hypothetical protein